MWITYIKISRAYPDIYDKPQHLHFLCHGLGDWGIQQNRGEARENIETAYLYRDMMILAKVAEWMGIEEDRKEAYRVSRMNGNM